MRGSRLAVRTELKNKSGTVESLSTRTGFAPSTVRTALRRLQSEGYAVKEEKGQDPDVWHYTDPTH